MISLPDRPFAGVVTDVYDDGIALVFTFSSARFRFRPLPSLKHIVVGDTVFMAFRHQVPDSPDVCCLVLVLREGRPDIYRLTHEDLDSRFVEYVFHGSDAERDFALVAATRGCA